MNDPIADAVLKAAEAAGIAFSSLPCAPELADTAQFCAHYGVPESESANAILVCSKRGAKQYALCLALATTRLDVNRVVRAEVGAARLSFASPEETLARTGMMIGGVTPIGLETGDPILIDAAVMANDLIVIGGGSRSLKLRLNPEELLKLKGARVVTGLAQPLEDREPRA